MDKMLKMKFGGSVAIAAIFAVIWLIVPLLIFAQGIGTQGSTCSSNDDCASNLSCRDIDPSTGFGTCDLAPGGGGFGASCGENTPCGSGFVCSSGYCNYAPSGGVTQPSGTQPSGAQPSSGGGNVNQSFTSPSLWPSGYWGRNPPLISCTGLYGASGVTYPNQQGATKPCTSLNDLVQTFINVIYLGITIAIFVISPISLAIGGIFIIVGGANPGLLSRGKEILKFTVIGIVIVLIAFLLVKTFIAVLGIKKGLIQGFGG